MIIQIFIMAAAFIIAIALMAGILHLAKYKKRHTCICGQGEICTSKEAQSCRTQHPKN